MPRPVALITNFSKTVFPRILSEIEAGPHPPTADWYIGTYGISKPVADAVAAAGFLYAPVFAIQPKTSSGVREQRRVRKTEAALLDPDLAGRIPGSGAVVPPVKPRAWGIEFGQRYRDYMRRQRRAGVQIDSWQFDEILGKCATSAAHRAFAAGILRGLAEGRPELGDTVEQGFVWFGLKPLTNVPGPSFSEETAHFWEEVERAALFLVGEEYPIFRGDTMSAATEQAVGHKRLVGGLHRELGRKYICGMTPGWTPSPSLRGNVDGKPREFVTDWRRGFIKSRKAVERPSGYAQFRLTHENVRPGARISDAVASLQFASVQLSS
jgi:hypothetical protein